MNKFAKSILSVSAAAIVATATLTPAFVMAYGDNTGTKEGRPVYTTAQINAGDLGNKITFNSITDSGKIGGDERNFVGAMLANSNATHYNADAINVEDGQILTIRLYVHNNSPLGEAATAKGVGVSFALPTAVAKSQTIVGYIDADAPATPTRYFDEVTLNSTDDFYLEYVQGSAQYRNENGVFKLADTVINGKTLVGYKSMNGEIPGCFKYSGEATIQVKVHKSVNSKVAKTVRIKNSGTKFAESVEAKVGDEVEFQIEYVNLLQGQAKNVMIRDVLPNNLEYVENSTYLYNSNHREGILLSENTLTTSGINIGDYNSKGNAYIRFTAKVVDKSMACGNNQLVNWGASTVDGKVVKDDASVMVVKTCPDTPVTPVVPTTGKIVATGASDTILISALGAGTLTAVVSYAVSKRASRRKF